MTKNIIVLMDGTWNSLNQETNGEVTLTNVAKLKNILVDDKIQQYVFYDDGVGADAYGLSKLFDGATGYGINDKIIQGYQFIMQHYLANDNIYLFGFSRGAYTVRYIADFIAHMGLLKQIDGETSSQQFGRVNDYFNQYTQLKNGKINKINPSSAVMCQIRMIGVWDTVGELGIPISWLNHFNHQVYEFHDTILHPNVLNGYQALAIDEKRKDFIPCLWSPRSGIKQIWFSGVHCDIGGGYPESGLSDIALGWMISIAYNEQNILINNLTVKDLSPDPLGTLHDSSSSFPFDILSTKARIIPDNSLVKASVKLRMEAKEYNYNPTNLPQHIQWV